MAPDHYATLGLSPTSEDVVIRAAYRALIRRYHPDGNASTAAAARARAINAAYEVLIDPERRAQYDALRSSEAWPHPPKRRSRLPAPSRLFAAACVTVLLVLVYLVTWSPLSLVKPPERVTHLPPHTPKPAAELPSLLPVEEPAVIAATDEEAVANPQLDGPLPTVPLPPLAPAIRPASPKPAPPRLALARPVVAQPAVAQPSPSFNCRAARTPGEMVVCGDANLASLDRQQALFYSQSWLGADPARRSQLQTTHGRFLARRDSCRSAACTRAAYLGRMREVSEIMMGPAKRAN